MKWKQNDMTPLILSVLVLQFLLKLYHIHHFVSMLQFSPYFQMCERAAEAHKSKGVIQPSRRSRVGTDPAQSRRSSIDAILDNSNSPLSQVFINCFYPDVVLQTREASLT